MQDKARQEKVSQGLPNILKGMNGDDIDMFTEFGRVERAAGKFHADKAWVVHW